MRVGPIREQVKDSELMKRPGDVQQQRASPVPAPLGAAEAIDGDYGGDICLGPSPNGDPARCFQVKVTVRDGKIVGGWAGREGVTVTLAGEVSTTGDVKIEWHAESADGSQFARAALSGAIQNGHLDARGTFGNGRTISVDWAKTLKAPDQMPGGPRKRDAGRP